MRTTVGSLASWLMAYTMMQVGYVHGSLALLAARLDTRPCMLCDCHLPSCWISAVQSARIAVGLRILRSALLQCAEQELNGCG